MSKLLPLLACLAILYACGHDEDVPEPMPPDQQLALKFDKYVELTAERGAGPHGWPDEDDCDALLFTGLWAAAQHKTVDIESARGPDGAWYRNPSQACYTSGGSGSSISRDMFLGLMWYAQALGRKDIAKQVFDYATDHSLKMGEGVPSRIFLTPQLYGTIGVLTGEDHLANRIEPVGESDTTGFEAHLSALHLALRVRAGRATSEGHVAAASQAARQPRNPLFAAVLGLYTGDQTPAVMLLLDQTLYPADRLPTSADHCEAWLTQRDAEDSGWQPCPDEAHTHSGGDFLFAAALALGKI